MKIIVEHKIPYIKGLLEPYATVRYLSNEEITPAAVADADALLVRTRTLCNRHLLHGSRVRFIGSATIGTDHIDLDYCASQGIAVHNAPGCNAPAVAQWVMASIARYLLTKGRALTTDAGTRSTDAPTLGIVGVGHVGGIVERWARQLGFNVLLCDPPRAERESNVDFVTIEDIFRRSDFITFHTPLTMSGPHPTHHICNASLLNLAERRPLILNAARGGVCRDEHLAAWRGGDCAIDCWEGEPQLNARLLQRAFIATPHIAGYSAEGKQRGTAMIIDALNRHFRLKAPVMMPQAPLKGMEQITWQAIITSYNPLDDTHALRNNPMNFEHLRNNYTLRPEVR